VAKGKRKPLEKGRLKGNLLETKSARADLEWRAAPYYTPIGQGLDLGYRKGKLTNSVARKPGAWVLRRYVGGSNPYRVESLDAHADDFEKADGAQVLEFWQAQERARDRMKGAPGAEAIQGSGTIGDAVNSYIAARAARNKHGRDARYRLAPVAKDEKFASTPIAQITEDTLREWRDALPGTLKPATIRRTLSDLRAALTAAVDKHRKKLPDTIRNEIKAGLKPPPNENSEISEDGEDGHVYLTDSDVRHIVDAAYGIDADFGALVLVLAATGTRFSQAARITVAGLQIDAERLIVPASFKGKGNKKRTPKAVPVGPDVIERLKPLVVGRAGTEPLLMHWIHRQTGPAIWERDRRERWTDASFMLREWRKAIDIAGVKYVKPYALRDSSIGRLLLKGIPVRIIAGLHDTSTAMIERHYSTLATNMGDELARQAIVSLTSAAPSPLRVVG
jgi:integrase